MPRNFSAGCRAVKRAALTVINAALTALCKEGARLVDLVPEVIVQLALIQSVFRLSRLTTLVLRRESLMNGPLSWETGRLHSHWLE